MSSAISGLTSTGVAPNSLARQGSNKLGKDEFLKLLVAQLANQDPTNPTDNQAFIAQLAQFSTVEQQSQMNSTLESLLVAQASSNQTGIANLVGKEVIFKSDTVSLPGEGSVELTGRLAADATRLNASITDSNGKAIRTITLEAAQRSGDLSMIWDGLDSNGNRVPAGNYKVKFTAADKDNKAVGVESRGLGRATGVSFDQGVPLLNVNGVRVRLSDIIELSEPKTPTL